MPTDSGFFDTPNTLVDGTYTLRVKATDQAKVILRIKIWYLISILTIQVPTIALDAGQDTGANTADVSLIFHDTFTIGNVDPDVIKVVVTIDGHDYNATKVGAGW